MASYDSIVIGEDWISEHYYTGFFAEEDLYEVAKGGNPEKGSWVVAVDRADHLDSNDFVRKEDEATLEMKPVRYDKGTFVFRLAGRERQQSATYYTPEVLTKFVVSQALEELLTDDTSPEDILRLTICEPALGSGAFAIEAVRQLAAEYLKRKQAVLGKRIEPDKYVVELQKVKAHIALHQVYGVDLNATAVELAEISLWLDTMVAGLQAPWFGLHLRRGNSLIGCRRAVYSPADFAKKAWLATVPTDVPLGQSIGTGIHHFLLPAHGWGAVVETDEAKTYAPGKREELRLWRNNIRRSPSATIIKRLVALAHRVEALWDFTLRRLTIAESEIRRDIHLWGDAPVDHTLAVTREQIEAVLYDDNGTYRRLRRAMDAWCAMWYWPLTTDVEPPDWNQWVGGLETLLGIEPKAGKFEKHGQISLAAEATWHDLDFAEDTDRTLSQAQSATAAVAGYPWLDVAASIAQTQGFFHWELDFAPVFAVGGFDLQVGNPPWVRPDWDEASVLAEFDPWWQLADKSAEMLKGEKRAGSLAAPAVLRAFLDERAEQAGTKQHLGSVTDRPVLTGLQPDLYRCFMERTWRSINVAGIAALIHPESHFTELRAKSLRSGAYRRLRRHWQFKNNAYIFEEISDKRDFGVHVYGSAQKDADFIQGAWIFHPSVAERSLVHDGSGPEPGVRDDEDRWNVLPHSGRVIRVDHVVLCSWANLIDEPGTPAEEARMLYPVNRGCAAVLDKIAGAPRLGDIGFEWTAGWHESADRKLGLFESRSAVADRWEDVILQGPHLTVATPLFKQPNETAKNRQDYTELDLDGIGEDFIPRTNYQVAKPYPDYLAAYPKWQGEPSSQFFRLAWRAMADSATVRTLHAAILPPGPTHVLGLFSLRVERSQHLAIAAAFASSLVADFFVKVTGVTNIKVGVLSRIPHVQTHMLQPQLIMRTLRLNCVVEGYSPLLRDLFQDTWRDDDWAPHVGVDYPGRRPLGNVTPEWTWHTPLRRAADRRQALVEIDAIVAIMLGITSDELLAIYRTQFPVLQKYEREALYDANGRQLPGKLASEYRKKGYLKPADLTVNGVTYVEPFVGVDRAHDMELAHKHFSALLGGMQAS